MALVGCKVAGIPREVIALVAVSKVVTDDEVINALYAANLSTNLLVASSNKSSVWSIFSILGLYAKNGNYY